MGAMSLVFLAVCLFAAQAQPVRTPGWTRSNIGRADQIITKSKNSFIATDVPALACVDSESGKLAWRRLLSSEDSVVAMEASRSAVFTSHRGNSVVRAWKAASGSLLWEADLGFSTLEMSLQKMSLLVFNQKGSKDGRVVVAAGNGVACLSERNGGMVWSWSAGSGVILDVLADVAEDRVILIVKTGKSSRVVLLSLSGEVKAEQDVSAEFAKDLAIFHTHSTYGIAGLGPDGSRLCFRELDSTIVESSAVECKSFAPLDGREFGRLSDCNGGAEYLVQVKQGSILLKKSGAVAAAAKNIIGMLELQAGGAEVVLKIQSSSTIEEGAKRDVSTVRCRPGSGADAAGQATDGGAVRYLPGAAPAISRAFLHVFGKKSARRFRALVQTSDDRLFCVSDENELLWSRDEGLAYINDLKGFPLHNLPRDTLRHRDVPFTFFGRLQMQLWDIVAFFDSVAEECLILADFLFPGIAKDEGIVDSEAKIASVLSFNDRFGYHPIMVAMTDSYRVFGIWNGEILWSVHVGEGYRMVPVEDAVILLPTKWVAQVFVIDPLSGKSLLSSIEADTLDLATHGLEFEAGAQWHTLPLVVERKAACRDSSWLVPVMLLVDHSEERILGVFPPASDARALLRAHAPSITLYSILAAQAPIAVVGHEVSASLEMSRKWSIHLSSHETLAAAASGGSLESERLSQRAATEVADLFTPTRVSGVSGILLRGDRSVMVKTMGANLVALLTAAQDPEEELQETVLTVVDAIRGNILYKKALSGTTGPYALRLDGNSVFYAVWNVHHRRSELHSVSFFESDAFGPNDLTPWGTNLKKVAAGAIDAHESQHPIFNGPSAGERVSAMEEGAAGSERGAIRAGLAFLPFQGEDAVFLKSYSASSRFLMFTKGFSTVSAIGTTNTLLGVNQHMVTVAVNNRSVLAFPFALLDPRRPMSAGDAAQQAQDKAEGLLVYHPQLPLDSTMVLNGDKEVAHIRRLYALPTSVESTSLVVGAGLDVFTSQVCPAGQFDRLPTDFNSALLLGGMAALAAVTAAVYRAMRQKAHQRLWK